MKTAFVLACFAFLVTCQALSWNNCNSNAIIRLDGVSPTGTITSATTATIRFTASTSKSDASLKAIVNVEVKRSTWIGYVDIPNFVYNIIGPRIKVKGVRHLGGRQFEVGCEAASKILKSCPPAKGTYTVNVDMGPIFKMVRENAGSVASFLGSGTYRINADAKIQNTGESLACVRLDSVKVKM